MDGGIDVKPIIVPSYKNKIEAREIRRKLLIYEKTMTEYDLYSWWTNRIFLDLIYCYRNQLMIL
jgi:hypothetical protein